MPGSLLTSGKSSHNQKVSESDYASHRSSRRVPSARPSSNHDTSTATMKALVKKERKPGLWLEDVPLPQVGINDVVLSKFSCGLAVG